MKKRIFAFLMTVVILFTSINLSDIKLSAEETASAVPVMLGNGENLAVENAVRFAYGTKVALSLEGIDAATFYIQESGISGYKGYNKNTVYEPGTYLLGYYYQDENDNLIEDKTFTKYGFTIAAAELKTPTSLSWSGTKASWDTVTTDQNGNTLKDGITCNYKVTLYRDGVKAVEAAEEVEGVTGDRQAFDFAEAITNGGKGKYTFTVQAVVPEADTKYYTESTESAQSEGALSAVEFTLAKNPDKAAGIASVTPADSFLLLSGVEGSTKEIAATPATDWLFGSWTAEAESGSAAGISFASTESASTTVSVPSGYDGPLSVGIIANPREEKAPEISNYEGGTEANPGRLAATVLDSQSGLAAYAFSAKESKEDLEETEWTTLSSAVCTEQTYNFSPVSGGKYYFYAKDADGNISRSETSIPVTAVTYEGYYENSVKKSKKDFYIGSGTYTLPDLTDTSGTVFRKGYRFAGWYTTAGDDGTKVDSLTENPAAGDPAVTAVTYYAGWTPTVLGWETPLTAMETPYIGGAITLTAKVNETTADVTYTWYRKNSEGIFEQIAVNSDGTYQIRNVSDSGVYRVDAAITYKNDADEEVKKTLEGSPVEIKVIPANLSVKAKDTEITYGNPAPTVFEVSYEGLQGEDTKDISKALITEGSLSCTYVQGASCREGGYPITFSSDFTSPNYTINQVDGKLTVNPKNAEAADTTVTVSFAEGTDSYTYTGSAITPGFLIMDGEKELKAPDDYEITSYSDNIKVGTGTAEITFRGNYTGKVSKKFTISSSDAYTPEVSMEGWTYGQTAKEPSVSGLPESVPAEQWETYYYYLEGALAELPEDLSGASDTKPVNAGSYTVYAVVKDTTGSYAEKITRPVSFTIAPKTIYLVAGSKTWEYDGNPHSYDSYTIYDSYDFNTNTGNEIAEKDVFVLSSESFRSIQVTGSVTDVTPGGNAGVLNQVSYELTSVTNAGNYDIQCVSGTLKVTPTQLPSPANLQWDGENPGTATWVAISRTNLQVKYEVSLYMHDAAGGEDSCIVQGRETLETSVDFKDEIHQQISSNGVQGEGSKKSFYFKVKTLVAGSADGKTEYDYEESEDSDKSPSLYTATIRLTKKLCDDETVEQEGLESIGFTGEFEGSDAVTLIAGESFTAKAVPKAGYAFTGYSYCSTTPAHSYASVWHPTKTEFSPYFTSSYNEDGVIITLRPELNYSLPDVEMTASVTDIPPTYENFTASNIEGYSGVNISIELMDTLGIKQWRLQKVKEITNTREDGSTYITYEPDSDYNTSNPLYTWHDMKNSDGTYPVYVPVSIEIAEPGAYRIQFRDKTGVTRSTDTAFTVYQITFAKGDTEDADPAHVMNPIYKLANTEITLPECTYTKEGYSFQNWKGETTGISVDKAVFKANANDTLTACWTNDQYTYTVEYYYMDTEGNYSEAPSETANFTGKYGETIVASDLDADTATEMIQKPKKNYTNDAAPGVADYKNKITLTGPGQILRIYYKTEEYTITYKYTVPGDTEETTITQPVRYGAAITEEGKPQKQGYDFVGWVFEGYGSAPETMPAKNLTATGTFVAQSANYQVVYHLETLGEGSTHTGVYSLDATRTQEYKSRQDEQITAYLTKGSELAANETEGSAIDGFTLKGVIVTKGGVSNAEASEDTLPAGIVTSGSTTGTVTCNPAETLYINYYYTRNVYNLTLEVWKDSREAATGGANLYRKAVACQYGQNISGLTENYAQDAYYLKEDGTSKLDGFTMPEGYKFASYTDFSTGTRPETMPAGDVTVIRDVVLADKVKYYIHVYFEKSEIGSFDEMAKLTYEAAEGTKLQVVKTGETPEEGYTPVYYDKFVNTLNNYSYYEHVALDGSLSPEYVSEEKGTVVDGDTPLELKVYFERIKTTATINYYYGNSETGGNVPFASITVEGKWGSQYEVDPTALLYNTPETWVSSNPVYQNQQDKGIVKSFSPVSSITASDGSEQDGLAYDFCANSYLVSFQSFYRYFNDSDIITWEYPSHTFTTVTADSNRRSYDTGYGKAASEAGNAGLGDTILCYFGATTTSHDARCNVYYNEIVVDDDFYLDVRLNYSNLKDKTDVVDNATKVEGGDGVPDWYSGTAANGNQAVTKEYEDYGTSGRKYIPITYPYNGTYYQLRIMNKCAIVNGTPVPAGEASAEYPAANATKRTYTYTDEDTLKPGFTRIEEAAIDTKTPPGEYYFYDPDTIADGTKRAEMEAALGSEPCVFLADLNDRFIQGAYVSFSQGSGTAAYQQAKAFLDAYQSSHAEEGEYEDKDESASALAFSNTGYGGTYVYGEKGYLTYNFYYNENRNLTFFYNGNTHVHSYVYGKTVPKSEVVCPDVAVVPEGYQLVWYLDGSFTEPIPSDGLKMTEDRVVYGRMEKKTVPNKEYIYYELADPIQVGETSYQYVTQDNIETLRSAGKTIEASTESKPVKIDNGYGVLTDTTYEVTTYTYDGVVVMVEIGRPTVSYMELYLAKDSAEYTAYYNEEGSYETAYGKTGFHYDETNTDNRSYGYVNTSPLNLKVYFARDKYQVEVNTKVSAESNPEYRTFSIDQTVRLEIPVKAGYIFAGWKWEYQDTDDWKEYTPAGEADGSFKMPAYNLRATAEWAPAEFEQKVTHYFQTANQVYDVGFISQVNNLELGAPFKTISGVSFSGITGTAKVYLESGEGSEITAVVLTTAGGEKYYFSGGELEEETLTLAETYLVAAETRITVKSEDADTVSNLGAIDGLSMYSYSYTSCQSGASVQTLKDGAAYTPVYGMTLEYYYTRSANCTVRLLGVATDGGASGISLNGAGQHIYGEKVTLVAALADGYELLGWYKAGDVLADYPDSETPEKALSEYAVKNNLADDIANAVISAVSMEKNYVLSVTDNLDLVAVSKADDVVAPNLEIKGKTSYTYGYETSADNALMAVASLDAASGTAVTGYQWYRYPVIRDENGSIVPDTDAEPEKLEGEVSATLLIQTGLNAGEYRYQCRVSYKNSANGRTGELVKEEDITVNKAKMTVTAYGYSGVFDNQEHSIRLDVSKPYDSGSGEAPYTVYYSSKTALDEDNYSNINIATQTLPAYTHVNGKNNVACAHTTYFYIKDNTGNYLDFEGSAEVNIIPKTISIKAKNATFSKVYDGSTEVAGRPEEEGTDMYKFAHEGKGLYYELNGFLDGDTAAEAYILGCNAVFNDSHVTTAKSFTISDLILVHDTTGETEYDYAFPAATSLTFAGMITPYSLQVVWDAENSFVYNGTPQAPGVALSEPTTNVPDGENINLSVTGKQTNVGTYTAYAAVEVTEAADAWSSDYTFNQLSKEYTIVKRAITVKPVNSEIYYDGTAHTISDFTIWYQQEEDAEPVPDTVTDAYTKTAQPVVSYTDAGTYEDMQFTNLVISDAAGKVLTDNYDIAYAIGTMTIKRAPVTVSGIQAENKTYDGTTSAALSITDDHGNSTLVFSPLYTKNGVQDKLTLNMEKVSGEFESAAAGTGKTVNISISADALEGDSASNYELNIAGSQKDTSANIVQAVIALKADSTEVVYGETAGFTFTASGIIREGGEEGTWEDIADKVTGTPAYLIRKQGSTDAWTSYVDQEASGVTTAVGNYEIKVDVSGLQSENFTFAWAEENAAEITALLTVTQRPVALYGSTGEMAALTASPITKVYDGTTQVNAAPVKGTHYTFGKTKEDGVEVSASGVLTKDADFDLSKKTCAYDGKNVTGSGLEGAAGKVLLTGAEIANDNYVLINTSCEIPGEITAKDLTIKAVAKEIAYGTTEPGYEAEFVGFVPADGVSVTVGTAGFVPAGGGSEPEETAQVLSGALTFDNSTYEASGTSENRHVGTYQIVPGGFGAEDDLNGNYKIHYESAELSVIAATVYLTADNQELHYKVGNTINGVPGQLPEYTYTGPDWKYSEDEARYNLDGVTMPRTETGEAGGEPIKLLTIPGSYQIKITADADKNVSGIEKTNAADAYADYIFKAVDGTLTVKKYQLTINGNLTIPDKVYDGTKKIVTEPTAESIQALVYGNIDPADVQYTQSPNKGIDTEALKNNEDNHYSSENVGATITVSLTIALNEELSKRYELDTENTNVTATSTITARPIEIRAKSITIPYGSAVPDDYGIEAVPVSEPMSDANMGLAERDKLLAISEVFSGPTGYTCAYSAASGSFSEAGAYDVTPVGVSNKTYGNYAITCVTAKALTVEQTALATPAPVWDAGHPGTVSWAAVSRIGDVDVEKYEVALYEVSGSSETLVGTSVETTQLSYDFSAEIRENGGGQYIVKVKAIASEMNNTGKKNVTDSAAGETGKLYATKITPVFAGETAGKGAQVGSNDPIYVKNESSYVAIAGESGIPIKGVLKNATGYTVTATAGTGLTLGDGSISTADASYNTTVSIAANAKPAAETKVTLTLAARPATLSASFDVDKNQVTYGFAQADAPEFTAAAAPEAGDVVPETGYTYSYTWKIESEDWNYEKRTENPWEFPYVQADEAGNPICNTPFGVYFVSCTVTAERTDNGKKVVKSCVTADGSDFLEIKVIKGSYTPQIAFEAGKSSWTYGDSRNLPRVTGIPDLIGSTSEVTEDKIHLLYSKTGAEGSWVTGMFTDVGTYYVKAHIDATANLNEADTSNTATYTINQAKLDTPSNVQMTSSETAPYGKVTWDAVTGPKENGGAAESDSEIAVKYQVILAYKPTGAAEETEPETLATVSTDKTEYDFTNKIINPGKYYVTVQALVDGDEQDKANCADSDTQTIDANITIGVEISVTGDGVTTDEQGCQKMYDGTPMTLTASYTDTSGNTPSYEWMKGETVVGTGESISLTYAEDSASYVCRVTSGSNVVYSKLVAAAITPRPITVKTASDRKTYDGSALEKPEIESIGGSGLLPEDSITAKTMSASRTDAGSVSNTISGIEITRSVGSTQKVVYSSDTASGVVNNYVITVDAGTLTVVKRQVTIKAKGAEKEYDGTALTSAGYYASNPANAFEIVNAAADSGLVSGESVNAGALTYSGSITHVGTADTMPSGTGKVIQKTDSGEDVTKNYDITYEKGTLKITQRALEITAGSAEKVYDGTALTKQDGWTVSGGTSLAEDDSITSVTVTGERTNYGESDNVLSEAVIQNSEGVDVTSDYDISYVEGKLEIQKRAVKITAEDKESCYGEEPEDLTWLIETTSANAAAMEDNAIAQELNLSLSCTVTSTTQVGDDYVISVAYDTENQNYTVTTVPGTYQVLPAEIQLRAENQEVEYNKAEHSLTFTVDTPSSGGVTMYYSTTNLTDTEWATEIGKLTSGGSSDKVSTVQPAYVNVGSYTVYCYGTKENYEPGTASAILEITQKPIDSSDITVDPIADVTYNGSAYTPSLTICYGDTVLIKDTDYKVLSYENNVNAGQATVTIEGLGNYKQTREVNFRIQPKPVSLNWTEPADMTYDGTEKTVTAEITNRCGTDEVSVSSYVNNKNTAADTYTAVAVGLSGAAAANYILPDDDASHEYTIEKRNLAIKLPGAEKVYDGRALINHAYSLESGTTAAGETLDISYTGTQTNAGNSDNTADIRVLRGTEDVTANYSISKAMEKLTVTPKPLASGDITVVQDTWAYTGSVIRPAYAVSKVLITGEPAVTLTEGTDYEVSPDSIRAATKVGTYTIQVIGKGNYSGSSSVQYHIKDNTAAAITGITNGGSYCIRAAVEITDPNLSEVVIKKEGTEIASFRSFTDGRLRYTIDGSGAEEDGTQYTVYVKDLASKDADGREAYHEQTFYITLYPEHRYDADQSQYTWDEHRLVGTQVCQNTGDAVDTIINRWGTVTWDYAYSYSTPDGVQSGIQGIEARATWARVELLQNGRAIATQYVSCDAECGVGGAGADSGTASYLFTTYNPSDATAAGGAYAIPQKDESGNDYIYSLRFTPGKMAEGVFTAANDYAYSDSTDYSEPYVSCGYQRSYSYSPDCFEVPWKVTLMNLPKDEEGNMIYPSTLYIKVLFAMSADADDSETASGYQIISQQSGESNLGVPCTAEVNGDTVVYSGSYPVWKYIGGTTDSYYHRIQISGYDLNNEYVDVLSCKLKSVNDSDHVNHTIYHVNETDRASGTIQYELSALLPSLVFDRNDGSKTAHAVINSVAGGTVPYADIQTVQNPVRSGYSFQGWYMEPVAGARVITDVNVGMLGVTVYAHWVKIEEPPVEPESPAGPESPVGPDSPVEPGAGTETGTEDSPSAPAAETPEEEDEPVFIRIPERKPSQELPGPVIIPIKPGTGAGTTPGTVPETAPGTTPETKPGTGSGQEPAEDVSPENGGGQDQNRSLVVYTVNGSDGIDGTIPQPGTDGQPALPESGSDNVSHVTAELPDTDAVANAVLTEEEWQKLEDGGDIVIRLTIDDTKRQEDDEKLKNFMDKLLAEELSGTDDRQGAKTVQFKSYVDLRLEKKINTADWERMYSTDEPIEIVINIPEEMVSEGETIYLARADGSGYILIEDLDEESNTITFMTTDFDSEYVLVSIANSTTPQLVWNVMDGDSCRWHYIIFIVTLIYFLVLLVTLKRKQEEEEESEAVDDEAPVTDEETAEDEEDWKKRKRNSAIRRSVSQIVLLVVYIRVNIRGFCWVELPASVIGMLLITIEQVLTCRHKFKQPEDNRDER